MRVPTVVVRPGLPNGAASGFASGIIREPLAGVEEIPTLRSQGYDVTLTNWRALFVPPGVSAEERTELEALIAEAVDLIVSIARTPEGRRVREVVAVRGFEAGAYQFTNPE